MLLLVIGLTQVNNLLSGFDFLCAISLSCLHYITFFLAVSKTCQTVQRYPDLWKISDLDLRNFRLDLRHYPHSEWSVQRQAITYTAQLSHRQSKSYINSSMVLRKRKKKTAYIVVYIVHILSLLFLLCLIRFKFPYPLQWGPPTFAVGHSFAMMSAVLVSMVEVKEAASLDSLQALIFYFLLRGWNETVTFMCLCSRLQLTWQLQD